MRWFVQFRAIRRHLILTLSLLSFFQDSIRWKSGHLWPRKRAHLMCPLGPEAAGAKAPII
jgi:hypothetical protein